jgi:hypothetical protein
MKNMVLKVREMRVIVLIFSLLVMLGLHSCNKPPQLESTTWEGNAKPDMEITYVLDNDTVNIDLDITLTIDFNVKDAYITARVSNTSSKPSLIPSSTQYYKGTAMGYVYEEGKISMDVKWNNERLNTMDDGKWTGEVEKKTMTFNNVFGQMVTFTKKK